MLSSEDMQWTECVSPSNSYVEVLTSKLLVLGVGAFGRYLGHGSGAPHEWELVSPENSLTLFLPCEYTTRILQHRRGPSPELHHAGTLISEFQLQNGEI